MKVIPSNSKTTCHYIQREKTVYFSDEVFYLRFRGYFKQQCGANIPAKQHCQFSPFGPIFELNGLDWQCYLAGSCKTAPRILIFSIAIGAEYSCEVKNSEIFAQAFFKHKNSFLAIVF